MTTSEPSAELWQRVRAGDEDAFTSVYRSRADAIFGFCIHRTGDWAAAQDCVSVVFLEAWRMRDRLRDGDSLNGWLFGIANNVVRNLVRARRRHTDMLARLPSAPPVESVDIDAISRVDAARAAKPLVAALAQLRRTDRELIGLVAFSDLTTAEIATVIGIPIGTVKSRLSRARQRLAAATAVTDDDSTRTIHTVTGVSI